MNNCKVSVVVPIYNVQSYLNRCIESIVNQTYKNLEILLIDDGSPDNCPKMCDEWAEKDSRIKVILKKNEGLGMARNTGIDNASGEFVCFVDSDDYIDLTTVEKSILLATKKNADIVSYGYSSIYKNGSVRNFIPSTTKLFYENDEILNYILPNIIAPNTTTGETTNLWMSMCGALFSLNLLKKTNWKMVSEREIISEDTYSLIELYKFVKKVAILPEALYFYCENSNSLTHTFKKDRYEKIKYFYDACIKLCLELGYSAEVKERLKYPYLSFTIGALKMIVSSDLTTQQKKAEIKSIITDSHLQNVVRNMNIKKESLPRKLLVKAIKLKNYILCYFMIKVKI